MNNKKRLLSLSAGVAALLLGLYPGAIAFAESEDGGLSVGASLQTQIETDNHEGSSVGAATSANIKESDSGEVDSEDSHSTATTTVHREDLQRNSNEQGDNENNDDSDEVEVDHDSALQATTTIENSDEVHNRGQLRSFLNHLVKEDDRIADVQVSSTTIETQYSLPARFLWVIPASISAHVSVGTDGSVTITYPWYAFLFAKHDDEIKDQITQAASSTVGASASTTFSAGTQAHLLNLILSVLKGD